MDLNLPNLTNEQIAYLQKTFGGTGPVPIPPDPTPSPVPPGPPKTINGLKVVKAGVNGIVACVPQRTDPFLTQGNVIACFPTVTPESPLVPNQVSILQWGTGQQTRRLASVIKPGQSFDNPVWQENVNVTNFSAGDWILFKDVRQGSGDPNATMAAIKTYHNT